MSKATKSKPSGPAVFMYCVIAITAVIALTVFILHYSKIYSNPALFWTGVTCFTIMYHLWMRIILGNVSKLFTIDYRKWWFKEKHFEKTIYKTLKVKNWKNKALTYNPELYSVKNRSLEEIANTTAKSETDHWINVAISLSTLLFALIWGQFWVFMITAILAILFDSQFIIIQRYNRPRLIKLIQKNKA